MEMSSFYGGLLVGIIVSSIIIVVWYYMGKRKRKFDERYQQINQKANAITYGVTIILLIMAALYAIIHHKTLHNEAFMLIATVYVVSILIKGIIFAIMKREV